MCIRLDCSEQGVCPRTCLSARPVKPRASPPNQAGFPVVYQTNGKTTNTLEFGPLPKPPTDEKCRTLGSSTEQVINEATFQSSQSTRQSSSGHGPHNTNSITASGCTGSTEIMNNIPTASTVPSSTEKRSTNPFIPEIVNNVSANSSNDKAIADVFSPNEYVNSDSSHQSNTAVQNENNCHQNNTTTQEIDYFLYDKNAITNEKSLPPVNMEDESAYPAPLKSPQNPQTNFRDGNNVMQQPISNIPKDVPGQAL